LISLADVATLAQSSVEASRFSERVSAVLDKSGAARARVAEETSAQGKSAPTNVSDDFEMDLVTASSYPFAATTGVSLDDMSSGTTQLVAASQDDTASAVTNIGFDF
jgi:hypothetical protein